MDTKFELGQEVRVRSSQGVLAMVVVNDLGRVLTLCRKEELERALRENRDPAAVGFPKSDIVDDSG